MHQWRGICPRLLLCSIDDIVMESFGDQTIVPIPAVSPHSAFWFYHLCYCTFQSWSGGISNDLETDPSESFFPSVLTAHKNQNLRSMASTRLSWLISANKCFIDFHAPRKPLSPWTYHGSAEFMEP